MFSLPSLRRLDPLAIGYRINPTTAHNAYIQRKADVLLDG